MFKFKGTVNGISSGPSCKNGNARFTIMPLKPYIVVFLIQKVFKSFTFIWSDKASKDTVVSQAMSSLHGE